MANLYVNPAIMYFTVTLVAFRSSCKPVNSGDWEKKLRKHKNDAQSLDIDLDFGAGKYCASLRLSRGENGILEVVKKFLILCSSTSESLVHSYVHIYFMGMKICFYTYIDTHMRIAFSVLLIVYICRLLFLRLMH